MSEEMLKTENPETFTAASFPYPKLVQTFNYFFPKEKGAPDIFTMENLRRFSRYAPYLAIGILLVVFCVWVLDMYISITRENPPPEYGVYIFFDTIFIIVAPIEYLWWLGASLLAKLVKRSPAIPLNTSSLEKRKDKTLALEEKIYHPDGQLFFQTNTIYSPDNTFRKVKTRWDYDNRCRLQTLTEAAMTPNAKMTTYTYTPSGELKTIMKPNGILLTYGYNDLRLNTSLKSSDGTVNHSMDYNRLGHLIQTDGIIRTTDALGHVLTETFVQGFGLKNEYDGSGRYLLYLRRSGSTD